jgi:hypothetical protein
MRINPTDAQALTKAIDSFTPIFLIIITIMFSVIVVIAKVSGPESNSILALRWFFILLLALMIVYFSLRRFFSKHTHASS